MAGAVSEPRQAQAGLSRATASRGGFSGPPRSVSFRLVKSLATASYFRVAARFGREHAEVPVKFSGAMPTTVNARE